MTSTQKLDVLQPRMSSSDMAIVELYWRRTSLASSIQDSTQDESEEVGNDLSEANIESDRTMGSEVPTKVGESSSSNSNSSSSRRNLEVFVWARISNALQGRGMLPFSTCWAAWGGSVCTAWHNTPYGHDWGKSGAPWVPPWQL